MTTQQPLSHIIGLFFYCLHNTTYNPEFADNRHEAFQEELYNSYVGTNTAWFEPFVPGILALFVGSSAASTWLGSSLIPATLAYATVKGVGWTDWGNLGLNDLEMKLNNFP